MALVLNNTMKQLRRVSGFHVFRFFHDEFSSMDPFKAHNKNRANKSQNVPTVGSIASKYQVFRDVDATVILDVEEERQLQLQREELGATGLEDELDQKGALPNIFNGIKMERGKSGVYEVEDLVAVLRLNNAEDIFVCSVPKEMKYVDYICVVTGMSFRHMRGIAEFIRKVYKMRRNTTDVIPKIEGENSREWMALDLGNIALHIFSSSARNQYDLESLWSVGAKFDREFNKPEEPLVELYERHSIYLNDLKPLNKDQGNKTNASAYTQ